MATPSRKKTRRVAPKAKTPARPATADKKPARPAARRPLVLVVDDFTGARDVYSRLLKASGFEVEVAASGEEAIEKAVAAQPDLVLMDLVMPGVDGWEAIRRLRLNDRTRDSRILIITGTTNSEAAQTAKRAGCDAFLLKPVLPETLIEVVRGVLAKRTG
jgi:two-component system, cell cycle response regulator DivK